MIEWSGTFRTTTQSLLYSNIMNLFITCNGVNATLEAVPDTSPLLLTVEAPPQACCFCRFFFNVWDTLTLVLSSI